MPYETEPYIKAGGGKSLRTRYEITSTRAAAFNKNSGTLRFEVSLPADAITPQQTLVQRQLNIGNVEVTTGNVTKIFEKVRDVDAFLRALRGEHPDVQEKTAQEAEQPKAGGGYRHKREPGKEYSAASASGSGDFSAHEHETYRVSSGRIILYRDNNEFDSVPITAETTVEIIESHEYAAICRIETGSDKADLYVYGDFENFAADVRDEISAQKRGPKPQQAQKPKPHVRERGRKYHRASPPTSSSGGYSYDETAAYEITDGALIIYDGVEKKVGLLKYETDYIERERFPLTADTKIEILHRYDGAATCLIQNKTGSEHYLIYAAYEDFAADVQDEIEIQKRKRDHQPAAPGADRA